MSEKMRPLWIKHIEHDAASRSGFSQPLRYLEDPETGIKYACGPTKAELAKPAEVRTGPGGAMK